MDARVTRLWGQGHTKGGAVGGPAETSRHEKEVFAAQLGAMPHKEPAVQEQLHRRGRGWAVTGDCPLLQSVGKNWWEGEDGGLERPWENCMERFT